MKTVKYETLYEKLGEKCISLDHKSGIRLRYIPKDMSTTYCLIAAPCGGTDAECECGSFPLGMAHFLEHKLFANPDGEDTCEKLGKIGAYANAYTGYTSTVYLFSASEDVERGVFELVKSFFNTYFTNENVKNEKSIIAEEIRMYNDDPSDSLYFALNRACFENKAYHYSPCGSLSSIKKITPGLLEKYHSYYYRPEKSFIVICGNADIDKITEYLDILLPFECPPENDIQRKIVPEKEKVIKKRTTITCDLPIPYFRIGIKFRAKDTSPEEMMKDEMIAEIIGEHYLSEDNEFVGGFYERGDVTKQIFYFREMFDNKNAIMVLGGEAERPNEIIGKLKKYILSIPGQPMTQSRLDTMKKVMLARYLKMFDSTEQTANEMISYLQTSADMFALPDILGSITVDDINNRAKEIFKEDSIAIAVTKAPKSRKGQE